MKRLPGSRYFGLPAITGASYGGRFKPSQHQGGLDGLSGVAQPPRGFLDQPPKTVNLTPKLEHLIRLPNSFLTAPLPDQRDARLFLL